MTQSGLIEPNFGPSPQSVARPRRAQLVCGQPVTLSRARWPERGARPNKLPSTPPPQDDESPQGILWSPGAPLSRPHGGGAPGQAPLMATTPDTTRAVNTSASPGIESRDLSWRASHIRLYVHPDAPPPTAAGPSTVRSPPTTWPSPSATGCPSYRPSDFDHRRGPRSPRILVHSSSLQHDEGYHGPQGAVRMLAVSPLAHRRL